MARFNKIKKVIDRTGETLYYLGDGDRYLRINTEHAIKNLDSGEYILHETEDLRNTFESPIDEYTVIDMETMIKLFENTTPTYH